jgi:Xaa-Pro aminopeptidase
MFGPDVYIKRRKRLQTNVQSGLILFLGNEESPMNYPDNPYSFRQDSSFLYFFGLDFPGLAAVIDIDQGTECIFGNDLTVDDIIWMGPQPTLKEKCEKVGVSQSAPSEKLADTLKEAVNKGREIHFQPQYRAENVLKIQKFLGIHPDEIQQHVSVKLIKAVVAQRSIKSEEEILQIESALDIAFKMQTTAMEMARPGVYEKEIAAEMESIAVSMDGRLAFPTIFTIRGETLHNHYYGNMMSEGDLVINDSGAENALHYASDITRTIPIGGKFSPRQRDIYSIVMTAQAKAIKAVKPGIEFRNIHRLACETMVSGLKDLGLMKGDCQEAVAAGAHGLFFQCGLGHMMGLDIHDMEALGEDYVGYTDTIQRSSQFGLRSLRLGRLLETGFVVTIEPGLYFIPELFERWKAEHLHETFINYEKVESYLDFGGVRLEDDILVTEDGYKFLGRPVPKTIDEVEALASD